MFDGAAAARPVLPHLGRLLHPHREGVAQLRAQGEACTCMVSRWDRLEVKNLVIYTTIDLETVFPAAVAAHICHVTPTRLDQLPPAALPYPADCVTRRPPTVLGPLHGRQPRERSRRASGGSSSRRRQNQRAFFFFFFSIISFIIFFFFFRAARALHEGVRRGPSEGVRRAEPRLPAVPGPGPQRRGAVPGGVRVHREAAHLRRGAHLQVSQSVSQSLSLCLLCALFVVCLSSRLCAGGGLLGGVLFCLFLWPSCVLSVVLGRLVWSAELGLTWRNEHHECAIFALVRFCSRAVGGRGVWLVGAVSTSI